MSYTKSRTFVGAAVFESPAGTHVDAPGQTIGDNGSPPLPVNVVGDILGHSFTLTVNRANFEPIKFTGEIRDDNKTHGFYEIGENGDPVNFQTQDPLVCQPASAPQSDKPTHCTGFGTVPAGQPCPPAGSRPSHNATINGTVDLYKDPGGDGPVIGQLNQGDAVVFFGDRPMLNPGNADDATNGWCRVFDSTQGVGGAVWGSSSRNKPAWPSRQRRLAARRNHRSNHGDVALGPPG